MSFNSDFVDLDLNSKKQIQAIHWIPAVKHGFGFPALHDGILDVEPPKSGAHMTTRVTTQAESN